MEYIIHYFNILKRILKSENEVGIFIDTNTFSGLIKCEREVTPNLFLKLAKIYTPKTQKISFISTPFSIYEYLGLKITRPTQINFKAKGFHDMIFTPLQAARESAIKFYESAEGLQVSKLAKASRQKRNFVKPSSMWLYEKLIPNTFDTLILRKFITHLVWDHIYTTDYPDVVTAALVSTWPVSINKTIRDKKNLPLTRSVSKMYLHFDKQRKSKNSSDDIFGRAFPLKTLGDYVDTELIHFALFGYFTEEKCHIRVHCFTGDPSEKIENRLWILANAYFVCLLECGIKERHLSKLGYIHCIDSKSLERTKTIDVKKVVLDARRVALETHKHFQKKQSQVSK